MLQAQTRTEPADVTDPYSRARDRSARSCAHIMEPSQLYADTSHPCSAMPFPKQRRTKKGADVVNDWMPECDEASKQSRTGWPVLLSCGDQISQEASVCK